MTDAPSGRAQTGDTEPAGRNPLAWAGRLGAPVVAIAVYWALPASGGLSHEARAVAAVGVLMAILWMTEAMPLPITSLLPIVLFPLLGVCSIGDAAAPYADKVIYLFMGGFMIALAMERWGLHKRIAMITVLAVGVKPARLVAGFMIATAFLSMWMSNTATTVMMLPIGLSVITLTMERLRVAGHELAFHPDGSERPATGDGALPFATCLMLGIAYAASIGGLGTLIGTPPNLFLVGFLEKTYGVTIGFGQWMLMAVPLVIVFLAIAWFVLTKVIYRIRLGSLPGGRAIIVDELRALGPTARAEWILLAVFALTASLWIFRGPLSGWSAFTRVVPFFPRLTDEAIALGAALLLFAIPVRPREGVFMLDWRTAERLPWGVLLLFGGGLSLASAVKSSGLDAWIGGNAAALGALPTLGLVIGVTAVVIFLTELTSNTATATTFLPILGGVAIGLGIDPRLLVVPAALAASCAFMLPVATPPNAIVFGTGHVTMRQMVRAGFVLNLIGVALIVVTVYALAPWVLGVRLHGPPDGAPAPAAAPAASP